MNGKGDRSRVSDMKAYRENFSAIFGGASMCGWKVTCGNMTRTFDTLWEAREYADELDMIPMKDEVVLTMIREDRER